MAAYFLESDLLQPKPKYYFERAELLEDIDRCLSAKSILVLYGKAGVGKSSVARHYAEQAYLSSGDIAREIRGEYASAVQDQFLDILKKTDYFKRHPGKSTNDLSKSTLLREMAELFAALAENSSKRRVLLIFDHVENYATVRDFVRIMPAAVRLIITTRNKHIVEEFEEREASCLKVREFSRAEFYAYLRAVFEEQRPQQQHQGELVFGEHERAHLFSAVSNPDTDRVNPVNANKAVILINNNRGRDLADLVRQMYENSANLFVKNL